MVHRGEENLTCSALLSLLGPFEESALRSLTSALQIAMPPVGVQSGVDGTDAYLTAETGSNLVDEFRTTDGGAVDAYLVGTCIEQSFHVGQLVDATANGKGNIDGLCHAGHHFGKGLAAFERGGNVKEHQFVGTLVRVGFP